MSSDDWLHGRKGLERIVGAGLAPFGWRPPPPEIQTLFLPPGITPADNNEAGRGAPLFDLIRTRIGGDNALGTVALGLKGHMTRPSTLVLSAGTERHIDAILAGFEVTTWDVPQVVTVPGEEGGLLLATLHTGPRFRAEVEAARLPVGEAAKGRGARSDLGGARPPFQVRKTTRTSKVGKVYEYWALEAVLASWALQWTYANTWEEVSAYMEGAAAGTRR